MIDMQRSLLRGLLTVALIAVPVGASAQSGLESELDGYPSEIDSLESQYLKSQKVDTNYSVDARYNDGRVAYHLKDYQQAASLLFSVVDEPGFKSNGSYREGVYMLGDALFQVRNYITAAKQFQKVLDLGPGEYYEEAAARLVAIAYEMKDFDSLQSLRSRLSGVGLSGEIAYLSGKAFYDQGAWDQARTSFGQAAQSSEYRLRAQYYSAVAFVAEKKLAEAKRIFSQLTQIPIQTDEDAEIADLSWLALGRIAYEEEDVERALDNYGRLDRSSQHFDRSLWEQTWVLVSRGNFEEARRNVDIITYLDDPDSDILAQSQLLRADLSLKLGEYDTARADYQAVLDRFRPIHEQMDSFATDNEDMEGALGALAVGRGAGVPPVLINWIQSDPDMKEAIDNLRRTRAAEEALGDSYRMFERLAARLDSGTRVQSFPELAKGWEKGVEIETRLLQIRQELIDQQFAANEDSMKAGQKEQWSTLASELNELRQKVDGLSEGRAELAKKQRELVAEFDRMRRQLEETGFEIESQKAQLEAVEGYLSEDSGRTLSKSERAEAEKARDELTASLEELGKAQAQLEMEVNTLKESVGDGGSVHAAEQKLRDAYRTKLTEAEVFLDPIGVSADVQAVRAKIPRVRSELQDYFNSLDELAGQAVGGLSANVTAQRQLADEHRQSLKQLATASESGAGVLAYVNFMRARAEYAEIVLRGEVGVIDVVWQKKEDMSEKISKLFEDRTSELNLLQEAFEEVR